MSACTSPVCVCFHIKSSSASSTEVYLLRMSALEVMFSDCESSTEEPWEQGGEVSAVSQGGAKKQALSEAASKHGT